MQIKFENNILKIFNESSEIISINCYKNKFHYRNVYFDFNINNYDREAIKQGFKFLRSKYEVPLQIILDSKDLDKIKALEIAGFNLARTTYELNIGKKEVQNQLSISRSSEDLVMSKANEKFINLLYEDYSAKHESVNPLTASIEEFGDSIPEDIVYSKSAPNNFAFVEDNEIAYIHIEDGDRGLKFFNDLLVKMLGDFDNVIMEVDDTDKDAMRCKNLINIEAGEVYLTYLL